MVVMDFARFEFDYVPRHSLDSPRHRHKMTARNPPRFRNPTLTQIATSLVGCHHFGMCQAFRLCQIEQGVIIGGR